MANVKISQLTAKGSNLEASDRLAIAQDTGGGTFASKYVTGAEVRNRARTTYTSQHTLVLSDANKVVEMNISSGSNNLIVPTNASVPFPSGTIITLSQYGSGQVNIIGDTGVTLRSSGGKNKTAAQYSVATLYKRDTNEWYLYGDLTT
jgi:3D (Asp-Asp-Asp) domain-containing protein